jgi:hypothetical protein
MASREERVRRLVVAEQRQTDVVGLPAMADQQALREAVGSERLELQCLSAATDRQDGAPAALGGGDHLRCMLGVGVDDRRCVGRQQLGEQAQLGGEVGLHARVIVEMIATEIGEGGSLQLNAVEPVLVEAVRGGLEGEVRDTLGRQLGQGPMQGDGVGRREAAVDAAVGLDEANGAERGRLAAETGEDLAGEVRDRGLAAGAGDGDDGFGLGRVEARRHQRQLSARLRHCQDSHAVRHAHLSPRLDEDGSGAPGDRLGHEAHAVHLGSGNGDEQPPRAHLAAVGGDAGDLRVGAVGRRRDLGADQGLELHGSQQSLPSPVVRRLGQAKRGPNAGSRSRLVLGRR